MTYCASNMHIVLKSIPWLHPLLCSTGDYIFEVPLSTGFQVDVAIGWHWWKNEKVAVGRRQGFSPLLLCFRQWFWWYIIATSPLKLVPNAFQTDPSCLVHGSSLLHGSPTIVELLPDCFTFCALIYQHLPVPSKPLVASSLVLLLLFGCLTISCLS